MNTAVANIEIGATTTRLNRGLRRAGSAFRNWASATARGVGAAFGGQGLFRNLKASDIGKTAFGTFGGNLLGRGFDALMEGAHAARDFERSLIRFRITTDGTAESTNALRRQIQGVSADTAIAKDQVLAGASQYVALTGDAQGAAQAMAAFARIAQASGASVADVATATASLKTSMGLSAGDIEAAFSAMIIQGKEGAVEIKDLAGELASLAPQFAQFRGAQGLGGIREMGAAMQVVMKGAGSASEAATQLTSLMGELAKPEVIRKLSKVKINIFDKDPKTGLVTMRSASDIFEDIARNQKLSDPRIVAAIFGRKEAQQAVRSIRNHIGLYRDLKTSAQDTGAVQRDLSTFLQSDAGKIESAFNRAKLAIAEVFTPERIKAFAEMLTFVVDKAAKLVGFIDKIGTTVTNIIEAPKRDALDAGRVAGRRKGQEFYEAARGNKAAAAQAMLTEAARLQREMEDEGFTGEKKFKAEGVIEELRRRAQQFRAEADLWSPTGDAAKQAEKRRKALAPSDSGLTEEQKERARALLMKLELQRMRTEIAEAIKDGLKDLSTPKVEIGKKEVAVASANSAQHSRGPAR